MIRIHILFGLISLLAGTIALLSRKGSETHRFSGKVFFATMWLLGGSAALIGAFARPNIVSFLAGVLALYLVGTGFLAVQRIGPLTRAISIGLMLSGMMAGLLSCWLWKSSLSMHGRFPDEPVVMLLMYGVVGLSGAALDTRALWVGNLGGIQRLIRHLWRMGLALWMATASFFLGQSKLFPSEVRSLGIYVVPVFAVLIILGFELYRLLSGRGAQTPKHQLEISCASNGHASQPVRDLRERSTDD